MFSIFRSAVVGTNTLNPNQRDRIVNRPLKLGMTLAIAIAATVPVSSVFGQTFDYVVIASTETPIPGGTGQPFINIPLPAISGGNAVFKGEAAGIIGQGLAEGGIYSYRGGVLDVLVNRHSPIPGDPLGEDFRDFGTPTLDPAFNVAFRGEGSSGQVGIYKVVDGQVSLVADKNTRIPNSADEFTNFSTPWIYDGEVVFRGTGPGGLDGIYVTSGATLRLVASNQFTTIPDGVGQFTGFGSFVTGLDSAPAIKNGVITFLGEGTGGQEGIYAQIDGALVRIADKTTLVPDGGGATFPGFDVNFFVAANTDNGGIAFVGGGASDPFPNQIGIYQWLGGTLSKVADLNTVVAESGGTLTTFVGQGLSFQGGDYSFLGQDTIGPQAVYAILDGQLVRVAATGDTVAGRTVGSMGSYGQGIEDGSIAFNAGTWGNATANIVAIQEHRWLGSGSTVYEGTGSGSDWDDKANWPFGLLPRNVVPTVIDPSGTVTVHGPNTDVTLSSLQVGGGTGIATLWLHGGARVTVPTMTVTSTGVLTGDGVIDGNVTNNGTVTADNVTITGALTNNNLISGTGRINGQLVNATTGEVRVAAGESLRFTGLSNSNSGRIEAIGSAIAPAEIEFDGAVTNEEAEGEIFARNASLRFNGGLTNQASFSMSFGTTDLFGDIVNVDTGTIIVSGNSNVTFYDDVVNDGELRTSTGSEAVFFGDVSGPGAYTGSGTVFFEGDFSPGSSPAEINFGGDVVFGSSSELNIELGGLIAGTEFDMLAIAGNATLDGTLDVSLIGGFSPLAGDTFEILSGAGGLSGTFASENLPALTGQLFWNVNYDTPGGLVVLEVATPYTADFDLDGDVDADDLAQWQGDHGLNGMSDADGDGDSDGSDFLAWQQQFGSMLPTLTASLTVPEPSTLLLLFSTIVCLSLRSRLPLPRLQSSAVK